MSKTYFYRLYQYSKTLFTFVLGFSLLTIFFNLMGDEVMPFFVWGMFSEVKTLQETYDVYEIKIDGKHYDYTNLLTDPNRFYITGPLNMYRSMKEKGEAPTRVFFKEKMGNYYTSIAPILEPITNELHQLKDFPAWLKRYLEQSTQKTIRQLEVNILQVRYLKDGNVEILGSKRLLDYEG